MKRVVGEAVVVSAAGVHTDGSRLTTRRIGGRVPEAGEHREEERLHKSFIRMHGSLVLAFVPLWSLIAGSGWATDHHAWCRSDGDQKSRQ